MRQIPELSHVFFTCYGVGVHDVRWYVYRFELLRSVTYNSLLAQANRNFRWVVFVGRDMPAVAKYQLEDLLGDKGWVDVVPIASYGERARAARAYITENVKAGFVIESRIDDDDALNSAAVEEIQRAAATLISGGAEYGAIGIAGGYDWLCEDGSSVRNHQDNLAIGLSIFRAAESSDKGILDYRHDDVVKNIEAQYGFGSVARVAMAPGGYLYVKHSLSDSSYFGMRARVRRDPEKSAMSDETLARFGIPAGTSRRLTEIFSESPVGYPGKAISLSIAAARSGRGGRGSVMGHLLRDRLDPEYVRFWVFGAAAQAVCERAQELALIQGEIIPVAELDLEEMVGGCDVVVASDDYVLDRPGSRDVGIAKDRLSLAARFVSYFIYVKWTGGVDVSTLKEMEHGIPQFQAIGGWDLSGKSESEIDAVLSATARQMVANLI